jgi:glycosyltransferase involved in cell wall biosynthesis
VISFVVPAYNEEALLGGTLDAIHTAARACGEPYEIVVADDDSSDATAEIARESGATVISVRHRQIAATRNSGARAARGKNLFFVDADSLVSPELLAESLAVLRSGAVGGGAAIRFVDGVPLYGRAMEWLAYRVYRWGKLASGAFLFCTREAFDAVGGFDERLFGSEELFMSRALAARGRFVTVRHTIATSGRRLRLYSAWTICSLLARLALRRGRLYDRSVAGIWYDGRRETTPPS